MLYPTRNVCSQIEDQYKKKISLFQISKQLNVPIQEVREIACNKKFITFHLQQFCKENRGKTVVIFDLETTGLPDRMGFDRYYSYTQNQYYEKSRILQVAWTKFVIGEDIQNIQIHSRFRKPEQFDIPEESIQIHKLTPEFLNQHGKTFMDCIRNSSILNDFNSCDYIIAHNILFDINIFKNELYRLGMYVPSQWDLKLVCTCQMTGYTRLGVLYHSVFDREADNLHDAAGDVNVLVQIFNRLLE